MNSTTTRRLVASVAAAAMMIVGLSLPAVADTVPVDPTNPGTPATVAADALPTVQIDGVVWSQTTVGNTVYVGGKFTTARPAGSAAGVNTVPRTNLLAYDITTGALITSFDHTLNGQVRSVTRSPDGSRVYVTGDFTQVDGQWRVRVAAFNTSDGSLVSSFRPTLASSGLSVAATNTAVYVGGNFTQAASVTGGTLVPHAYLAAFSASDGSLTSFQADADAPVTALAVTSDGGKLIVGGRFTSLAGAPFYGLGAVDPATGAASTLSANALIRDAGADSAITSLYADASGVYGTGYHYGDGGNLEGPFRLDPSTGDVVWIADCHGDSYSAFPMGDAVYVSSHEHYCGNMGGFPQTTPWTFYYATAFSKAATGTNTPDPYSYPDHPGQPSPSLLTWFPSLVVGTYTGQGQAGWSVTGNDKYLSYGGEFPIVNGVAQQGLVRFAVSSVAPNKQGPRITGGTFDPVITSHVAGQARIVMSTNWDRDNATLTYKLYRSKETSTPIWQQDITTPFWKPVTSIFTDTGLAPGSSQKYRITATDAFGNVAKSNWITVTVSATDQVGGYGNAVLGDAAQSFWRLSDSSGSTTSEDWAGTNSATVGSGVTFGTAGAIGDSNTAATFDGTSNGVVIGKTQLDGPQTFSVETWFKTTTTAGGKIVGFGDQASGNSGSYDRHVYMDTNGRVSFGVYPGTTKVLTSSKSYNDGQWHQAVATLGADGQRLYIDDKLVGADPSVTSAQAYSGYWRIGGDQSWSGANYFTGSIDDTSVYSSVLSPAQIDAHWVASGRTSAMPSAPSDAYGAAVFGLNPTLYWRLGESGGASTAVDRGPFQNDGTYVGNVTLGRSGALTGVNDTAARFDPAGFFSAHGMVSSKATFSGSTSYSEELWFKTTTTVGGKLIGFGSASSGTSSNYDRHVYMMPNGTLRFGAWTGQENIASSSASYNDGAWHHMVATQSSDGMKLYVDGQLVGTNPQTGAQDYSGYWRVGGDTSWDGAATWFDGSLDEVAVYPFPLNATQVGQHYDLGRGVVVNQPPTAAFSSSSDGLTASFDGTASSDPDGTVASYAWDFGDGSTGTGATATHTYASTGSYPVTLTVTDGAAATATVSHEVSVLAPNVAPTASFGSTAAGLAASFDASASSDPDGTVASYAWDFGDGSTGTGVTATHTYAATGTYQVTLVVTDNRGGKGTVTQPVSVVAPNVAPTASFTPTIAGLVLSVDASASSDPDGTVASYAWDFGDGSTGTGATATHTYAAPGTYPVTLTVTDNVGATGSTSATVTASAAATPFVADAFGRTVTAGWGSATLGGAWTLVGTASRWSVDGSVGRQAVPAGSTMTATLGSVSSSSTDLTVTLGADKVPDGGGSQQIVQARRVSSSVYYGARVKILSTGAVQLHLLQSGTVLAGGAVSGLTFAAGDQLKVRVQADGTSPTTLRAKIWKSGQAEPAAWNVVATDSTAALQVPASVGLSAYVSASTTNGPITFTYDDLGAQTLGAPAVNVLPTASFTATPAGLAVALDASASSDPDGSITSYAWTFGDGTTGTGVTANHSYATAGTYTVGLQVTDNAGGTASTSRTVSVAPPAGGAQVAADSFERTVASGWGSATLGGAWTLSSGLTSSVSGQGVLSAPSAGLSPRARLASVSARDVDVTATVALDQLANAGTTRAWVSGRATGWGQEYMAKANVGTNGSVSSIQLVKRVANVETVIATAVPSGITVAAGERLQLRLQLVGASPTTLQARVWKVGTTEPGTWQITATDSQTELQGPGGAGVGGYVAGTTTNLPFAFRWDDFQVTGL